tara:strand:- start:3812 stop:4012 length:201 start_codon:yes stop_codon:yes gene_type:complete
MSATIEGREERKGHLEAADVIRVLATIAVLGVHVTGPDVRMTTTYDVAWWSSQVLSLFRSGLFQAL